MSQHNQSKPLQILFAQKGKLAICARRTPGAAKSQIPQTEQLYDVSQQFGYEQEQVIVSVNDSTPVKTGVAVRPGLHESLFTGAPENIHVILVLVERK